ncbi:hypothetical protein PQO03_08780 [Lentisphaera profundi]|uniref:Uncharacterized protein n=1 Tax=Lentisphaera profundi TaxID=1658616 RepID=A0ABY7VNU5_9BACT|nr:hypothetical protein [Lentisphaera profundi]WDE95808.1 hypothetical protein PQO03_08780 [Lentisphaera profundi]
MIKILIYLLTFTGLLHAAEPTKLEQVQTIYTTSIEKYKQVLKDQNLINSQSTYDALKLRAIAYQKAGQLEPLIALRNFLDFYKSTDLVKLKSSTLPAVKEALTKLAKANNESLQKYNSSLIQLKKSYKAALQKRVKLYTQKDKIEIALSFQAELEKMNGSQFQTTKSKNIKPVNTLKKIVPKNIKPVVSKKSPTLSPNAIKLKLGDKLGANKTPKIVNKNITILATINTSEAHGIIIAHGGSSEGYALYLRDEKLIWAVRRRKILQELVSEKSIAKGKDIRIIATISRGLISLNINGVTISAKGLGPASHPVDGLQVGNDPAYQVGKYKTKKFSGSIKELVLDIK